MTRWLVPLVLTASLSGCIIYESGSESCDGPCFSDTETWDFGGTGAETDTGTEPEATLPTFRLVDATAEPGEALLTWIECEDLSFDYTHIEAVTFVGDASPSQLVLREDEAMLLIEVDDDAAYGQIEVILELSDGSAALLDGGFTILDPEAQGTGAYMVANSITQSNEITPSF